MDFPGVAIVDRIWVRKFHFATLLRLELPFGANQWRGGRGLVRGAGLFPDVLLDRFTGVSAR